MPKEQHTIPHFIGREHELCELVESHVQRVADHYESITSFRIARYYVHSVAGEVLRAMHLSALQRDHSPRLSPVECLIIASFYQDAGATASFFGDNVTSDEAHIHEQLWLEKSDVRSGSIRGVIAYIGRCFWGLSSRYGTSAVRLFSTVLATTLAFAVLYLPIPPVLAKFSPEWSRLEFRDDAFPQGHAGASAIPHALYFSLVTMTTVGYGDIKPVNAIARLVAPVEALFGVCLFGVFVTVLTRAVPARAAKTYLPRKSRNDEVKGQSEELL